MDDKKYYLHYPKINREKCGIIFIHCIYQGGTKT